MTTTEAIWLTIAALPGIALAWVYIDIRRDEARDPDTS